MEHLRVVFQRLQDAGLVLNVEKCQFGVQSVEYLGHHVDATGVSPLPSSVAAVRSFPPATEHKAADVFLGHVEFLQKIHPTCSSASEAADRCSEGQATEAAVVDQ